MNAVIQSKDSLTLIVIISAVLLIGGLMSAPIVKNIYADDHGDHKDKKHDHKDKKHHKHHHHDKHHKHHKHHHKD